MTFPLDKLPLELIISIFAFAVQSPSSYCALSLVSRATRSIVLGYAIFGITVHIGRLGSASSFYRLISSHPDVALRVRCLRLLYWGSTARERRLGAHEAVRSIIYSSVNITSLATSTIVLHNTINECSKFELDKTETLHLDCVNLESTRDVNRHPNSQALLSQITHLFGRFDHFQLFEVLVPYEGATWNFNNLTHFTCQTPSFPDECPRLQLLHDRTIFPVLEQIVFRMTRNSAALARAARVSERVHKYQLLREAKQWDRLYLAFDTKPDTIWDRLGDHEMDWNDGVRLVDCGGDDLIDPPDWPDEDVFTSGQSMVDTSNTGDEREVTRRVAANSGETAVNLGEIAADSMEWLQGEVLGGVEHEENEGEVFINASREWSIVPGTDDSVQEPEHTISKTKFKSVWRFLIKSCRKVLSCR